MGHSTGSSDDTMPRGGFLAKQKHLKRIGILRSQALQDKDHFFCINVNTSASYSESSPSTPPILLNRLRPYLHDPSITHHASSPSPQDSSHVPQNCHHASNTPPSSQLPSRPFTVPAEPQRGLTIPLLTIGFSIVTSIVLGTVHLGTGVLEGMDNWCQRKLDMVAKMGIHLDEENETKEV
jgi:hypothetical protein